MAPQSISVWFDPEGDYLEVLFDRATPGYFRETSDDRFMEKLDDQGRVLGFSILNVSSLQKTAAPMAFSLN